MNIEQFGLTFVWAGSEIMLLGGAVRASGVCLAVFSSVTVFEAVIALEEWHEVFHVDLLISDI